MRSTAKTDFNDPTIGLFDQVDDDPDYSDIASWTASQDVSNSILPLVYEQPKFIIKYLGDRAQNEIAAVNVGGYGSGQPGTIVSNFRVTARGTGQTGNAYRYVQSYYGKEF